MSLSDKLTSIIDSSKNKKEYTKQAKAILEEVVKRYDIPEQDIFDLLYVGKRIYSQGAGLSYKQVEEILFNQTKDRS